MTGVWFGKMRFIGYLFAWLVCVCVLGVFAMFTIILAAPSPPFPLYIPLSYTDQSTPQPLCSARQSCMVLLYIVFRFFRSS